MKSMTYHMRREDKEITDKATLQKILKKTQHVTLAMSKNNEPYLVSLSHGYDENHNCIYFHCAPEGKKLDFLKANPNVWGQVVLDFGYVQGECDYHYASVHFKGKVHFISDLDEKIQAVKIMTQQLDKNPEERMASLDHEKLKAVTVGRIDIDFMTGKKSKELTI